MSDLNSYKAQCKAENEDQAVINYVTKAILCVEEK